MAPSFGDFGVGAQIAEELRGLADEFETRLVAKLRFSRLSAGSSEGVLHLSLLLLVVCFLADKRGEALAQAFNSQTPLPADVLVLRLNEVVDCLGKLGMGQYVWGLQFQEHDPAVACLAQQFEPVALADA